MIRVFVIERSRGGLVRVIGTADNEPAARAAFDRARVPLWRTFGDLQLVRADFRGGVEVARKVLATATRVGRWSDPRSVRAQP